MTSLGDLRDRDAHHPMAVDVRGSRRSMRTILRDEQPFRHTRWRVGYHPPEVDAFVETVEEALRSPAPQLDAFDVFWREFTTVRLKPGYHMDDVDGYLERAEKALEQRERDNDDRPAKPHSADRRAARETT
jgi:DivIVA domain-containing protein